MKYVTASEAARRCNVSERTVRMWVKQGKLTAHHPQPNRLAIPEPEVDAIARERAQYEPVRPDVSGLQERLEQLEHRQAELEARIHALEALGVASVSMASAIHTPLVEEPPKRAYTSRERNLPPGAMLARHFAAAHGVNPGTFKDHYSRGFHGERLEISHRPKPGRNETEWYVTERDTPRVFDYWRRHGVTFTE